MIKYFRAYVKSCPAGSLADPDSCVNTACKYFSVLNSRCIYAHDELDRLLAADSREWYRRAVKKRDSRQVLSFTIEGAV